MTKNSGFYEEKIIERKIILELPNVKTTYEGYCTLMGQERLDEIASDNTLLNLVRERNAEDTKIFTFDDKPYQDLQILNSLYEIPFTEKEVEKKSFSISAENYLLYKIMMTFTTLGIPQYRKYELSQQLRYKVDEVFFSKVQRGRFGVDMLEEESSMLNDLMYGYVKYHRKAKYFRDDEMTKFAYNFFKEDTMKSIVKWIGNIHYKENLTKNYLPFYLLYLTVNYGIELYIIYEHSERLNCFKICDEKGAKQYIEKGCTILGLYEILTEAYEVFGSNDEPEPAKGKIWQKVLDDIIEASEKCITFKYTLEGSSGKPMLGQVDFIHNDPSKYDELMQYVGDFGGVIPMKGRKDEKILDGKKKLNYKKDRNKDKNK